MAIEIRTVRAHETDEPLLAELAEMFDEEYLAEHGPWNPLAPYGYSPAETRVIALLDGRLAGHVGYQPRSIRVDDREVRVGGVGGVLVASHARGLGLGIRMLHAAQHAMSAEVDFGYLGCREEVVPFYQAAGWHRIRVRERSLSRVDGSMVVTETDPVLICPAARAVTDWPAGDVDLVGTPW